MNKWKKRAIAWQASHCRRTYIKKQLAQQPLGSLRTLLLVVDETQGAGRDLCSFFACHKQAWMGQLSRRDRFRTVKDLYRALGKKGFVPPKSPFRHRILVQPLLLGLYAPASAAPGKAEERQILETARQINDNISLRVIRVVEGEGVFETEEKGCRVSADQFLRRFRQIFQAAGMPMSLYLYREMRQRFPQYLSQRFKEN